MANRLHSFLQSNIFTNFSEAELHSSAKLGTKTDDTSAGPYTKNNNMPTQDYSNHSIHATLYAHTHTQIHALMERGEKGMTTKK